MGMWVGRGRKARVAYGFDDIALVPGTVTINPNVCNSVVESSLAWLPCNTTSPRFCGRPSGVIAQST